MLAIDTFQKSFANAPVGAIKLIGPGQLLNLTVGFIWSENYTSKKKRVKKAATICIVFPQMLDFHCGYLPFVQHMPKPILTAETAEQFSQVGQFITFHHHTFASSTGYHVTKCNSVTCAYVENGWCGHTTVAPVAPSSVSPRDGSIRRMRPFAWGTSGVSTATRDWSSRLSPDGSLLVIWSHVKNIFVKLVQKQTLRLYI